jgi:hypothetical protein
MGHSVVVAHDPSARFAGTSPASLGRKFRSSRPDLDDLQALLAFGDADHHLLAGCQ